MGITEYNEREGGDWSQFHLIITSLKSQRKDVSNNEESRGSGYQDTCGNK